MNHRLLHIVPSLQTTGTAKQMTLLTEQLANQGFRCSVLSLGGSGPLASRLRAAGTRVEWIEPGSHRLGSRMNHVRRWLRASAPDLVHTWGKAANFIGRLAAATTRAKVIASYRSLTNDQSLLEATLDRKLAKWSDALIANSEPLRKRCEQRGLPADKLHCIPNGVPLTAVSNAIERRELRQSVAIPTDARVIGAIGPLTTAKRLKDVIWATELLKNARDDTYLVILGEGPQRWRLERFCDQVQIRSRVRFLGQVDQPERWTRALDVLWHAGHGDSVPNAALEAMASRVPVVMSDTEAHRELVVHDRTGCLVPLGDRAGFARQAIRVLDNIEFAAQLCTHARNHVRRQHDLQTMVDSHLAVYRRAIAAIKRGSGSQRAASA